MNTLIKPPCCNLSHKEQQIRDFLQKALSEAFTTPDKKDTKLVEKIKNSIVVKTTKSDLSAETNFIVAFINDYNDTEKILFYSKDNSETFLDEIHTHFAIDSTIVNYADFVMLYALNQAEDYYVGHSNQTFRLEAVEHIAKLSQSTLIEIRLPI